MTGKNVALFALAALAAIAMFQGCRSAATPAASFYTLTAVAPAPDAAGAGREDASAAAVGVGPVFVPRMLSRPQIVTRTAPNQVRVDEFHRWAGSLEENILQVLAQNLSARLAPRPVRPFPWSPYAAPAIRVSLRVQRFEGDLRETALLDVVWTVTDADAGRELLSRRSVIEEPVASADYDGLVAAQSRAIAAISEEMAEALNALPETSNP